MIEKFKFLLEKPDSQLADFLAPMPLEECAERLLSKHGKYFTVNTHVRVAEVDPDKYTFRMRVNIESRNPLNIAVVGSLNRQDDTTTQVLVARAEVTQLNPRAGLVIFGAFGAFISLLIHSVVPLLLALAIAFAIAYEEHHKYDSVVKTIEETLGVRRSPKKLKVG